MCGIDNKAAGVSKSLKSTKVNNPNNADVINLDHGDPVIFEQYWRRTSEKCTIVIPGYQSLSYFSNFKSLCWFLEPNLEEEIKRLHRVVGNANVDNYHIVVGTGSTQLIQAALFALCHDDVTEPVNVVSAAPYYSCYPEVTDFLQSRLYKWAGDAYSYNKDEPYIEFVRLWALVKDEDVAKRMTKFIEVNTIGVSKESQLRATKILQVISDSCLKINSNNFFLFTRSLIVERWEMLREVIDRSDIFSLPKYRNEYCLFTGEFTETHPAFAWLKCEKIIDDLEKFLRGHKVLSRSGKRFGSDMNHVRVSMVGTKEEFKLFLQRLTNIQEQLYAN